MREVINYDRLKQLLKEPIRNISHAYYDAYVEANAVVRSKAGIKTVIIRRQLGRCCDWCNDLVGIYDYYDAPDDIYKRHDNCKCMVTVRNENGTYTDVWSKKEYTTAKAARQERLSKIEDELNRANSKLSLEDIRQISQSSVLNMDNEKSISKYFKEKWNIGVEGFEEKSIDKIKITFAGYDDLLLQFPKAADNLIKIEYNKRIRTYGTYSFNGVSQIGPAGIGSYGTGLHEAAHALDIRMSSEDAFSSKVLSAALKKLSLRRNSREYQKLIFDTVGEIIDNDLEIFAYSIETEIAGSSNQLTKEIMLITKELYNGS